MGRELTDDEKVDQLQLENSIHVVFSNGIEVLDQISAETDANLDLERANWNRERGSNIPPRGFDTLENLARALQERQESREEAERQRGTGLECLLGIFIGLLVGYWSFICLISRKTSQRFKAGIYIGFLLWFVANINNQA